MALWGRQAQQQARVQAAAGRVVLLVVELRNGRSAAVAMAGRVMPAAMVKGMGRKKKMMIVMMMTVLILMRVVVGMAGGPTVLEERVLMAG
jgi:hypothetical protein